MTLASVLFTEYRRRVLGLLLLHPAQHYYLREIARLTGTVPGTLKRELNKLVDAGVLTVEKIGNQSHFTANRACPIFEELSSILRKTSGLVDVLVDGLMPLADWIEFAFVFGSVASGKENSTSDIDLMLIGDVGFSDVVARLPPLQETLGREINPKLYTLDEWRKLVHGNSAFVRDILSKPKLFVIGNEPSLSTPGKPS